MVGDRTDTDIAFGRSVGMQLALPALGLGFVLFSGEVSGVSDVGASLYGNYSVFAVMPPRNLEGEKEKAIREGDVTPTNGGRVYLPEFCYISRKNILIAWPLLSPGAAFGRFVLNVGITSLNAGNVDGDCISFDVPATDTRGVMSCQDQALSLKVLPCVFANKAGSGIQKTSLLCSHDSGFRVYDGAANFCRMFS